MYYFKISEFSDGFSESGSLVLQSCVKCKDSALEIQHRKEGFKTISLEFWDASKVM